MYTKTLSSFVSFALLLAMCAGALTGVSARTQTGNTPSAALKYGDDLRRKASNGAQSGERVDVIVQSVGAWSDALDSSVNVGGGSVKHAYKNFNARTVNLPAAAVDALARRGDVKYISLDREVMLLGHVTLTTGAVAASALGGATGYDGTGIGIVVMDSGLDPNHVAFRDGNNISRIVYKQDFTGEGRTDDPYGHGTHVAAIAAGNGSVAGGAYQGIAPNAKIINLRVLNSQGTGTVSNVLNALDWVLTNRANATYNMKVVNMSLGTASVDSYKNDPLCLAARRLVDAGIVVAAAAGNEGKDALGNKVYGQIHSPGVDPSVMTVGASNTFGTDARNDDGVTTYSSRGPTRGYWTDANLVKHYDNLVKPDLVAPGNKIVAAEGVNNYLVTNNPSLDADVSGNAAKEQMYLSGTSMATPVVAGASALLMQANPKLTPNMVKMILMYTAQPLAGFNNFEQGAGQINLEGAMRLARLVRTDLSATTPVGDPLLNATPPTPQTAIAGYSFNWGQGVIMDHTFATGVNLITKYQAVYGLGVMLSDGTVEGNGVMLSDGVMMSDGVMLSDNILTSSGITLSEGTIFCATSRLLGNGTLLSDGVMLSDGVLLSDGALLSDGVMLGDVATQGMNVMVNGDNTAAMGIVVDGAPGSLVLSVISKSQINLAWKDNSTNEGGFRIERSTDGVKFTQVGAVATNASSFSNTGLSIGTKYYYRVYAYTALGGRTLNSNVASATTLRR